MSVALGFEACISLRMADLRGTLPTTLAVFAIEILCDKFH
jgi:hypothetical protein